MWQASMEVEKLANYAQAQGRDQVQDSDVQALVTGKAEDNVFALVDAVSQGRTRESLKRLHDQRQAGSHELEILSMLIRQYRILAEVKDGQEHGQKPDEIARDYGMHPFVAKKMAPQAQRLSDQAVILAYKELTEADRLLKSAPVAPDIIMTRAVMHIL
jgi:DNA polymerase-3 subunit delta